MISYLSPGSPETLSGGTRKLYDHAAILAANGFPARVIHNPVELIGWQPRDIVVVPEVYGDFLCYGFPDELQRISFVQNGYLIDRWGCHDPVNAHPFTRAPNLVAIFTESQHTEDIIRERFPGLAVPLIRTHSSGNGRLGELGPFSYGEWPRERWICHFDYKVADANAQVFEGLADDLRRAGAAKGWSLVSLAGMSDEQIAETMRRSAIFAAALTEEGMCAPTSEAMISGCVVVCWPGGPAGQTVVGGPMEYLAGRAMVAAQDDVEALRETIVRAACVVDGVWGHGSEQIDFPVRTREWSESFQATYSRQGEIDELVRIFDELHGR